MKRRTIAVIVIPPIVAIVIMLFFASSYDFTPATNENKFGISAKVVYSDHFLPIMCPVPCQGTHLNLVITSEVNSTFVGYNICDGLLCVKNEGSNIFLRGGAPPESHTLIPIFGAELWKVGDSVNIRVKVADTPVELVGNSYPTSPYDFVNLGNSVIT